MTSRHEPDDEMARRLKATFTDAERDLVVSADGLTRIREKVDRRRQRQRWWHAGELVGAAAAITLVVAAATGSLTLPWSSDGSTTNRVATIGPSPQATEAGPGPIPSTLATPNSTRTRAVTVYYVGRVDGAPTLYAEVHERPVPAAGATIRDSIDAMLHEAPRDPTYSSPWPSSTTILGISVKGSTVVVDLSAEAAARPTGGPSDLGRFAALQLLHTVRGAVDANAIALRIDHKPVAALWGDTIATGGSTDEPLITDTETSDSAFAPVQIYAPAWGATLGTQVTFSGQARVFEATVNWEITNARGAVVRSGTAMASAGAPAWGEWSATVELTPGNYELRAFEISPKDGSSLYVTTKLFSVR